VPVFPRSTGRGARGAARARATRRSSGLLGAGSLRSTTPDPGTFDVNRDGLYPGRMTTATRLEELREQLVGREIFGTKIVDARPELSETLDGEDLTRVWLLLSPPETETWDLEVVHGVRRFVEEEARKLELPNTFVRFEAEGDEDSENLET